MAKNRAFEHDEGEMSRKESEGIQTFKAQRNSFMTSDVCRLNSKSL